MGRGYLGLNRPQLRLEDGFEMGNSGQIDIEQSDRARHAEFNVRLPPMEFERAGPYAIEVVWDGNLLGECRIQVMLAEHADEPE